MKAEGTRLKAEVVRNRAKAIYNAIQRDAAIEHLEGSHEAAAAFALDIKPVCDAVMETIKKGDLQAFKGLRGMLADLLGEINDEPELAAVLDRMMGRALREGMASRGGAEAQREGTAS